MAKYPSFGLCSITEMKRIHSKFTSTTSVRNLPECFSVVSLQCCDFNEFVFTSYFRKIQCIFNYTASVTVKSISMHVTETCTSSTLEVKSWPKYRRFLTEGISLEFPAWCHTRKWRDWCVSTGVQHIHRGTSNLLLCCQKLSKPWHHHHHLGLPKESECVVIITDPKHQDRD